MTSISNRRRLLAVLLLPFLMVLAGCGKLHADFEIQDVDTINATFDLAIDTEYAETTWDSAEALCEDAKGEETLGEGAPTVEPYEKDGQYGCLITGVITSEDYDSTLSLTEEDGEYHLVFGGDESAEQLTSTEDLGFDFRMTFTFPGEIIEASGGEIDGNSVTFTDVNDLSSGIDIRAEAGGGFPWIIVIVIVLVIGFLLLLVLAAIIFFVVRARKNKGGDSTPAGVPAGFGAAGAAGSAPTAPPAAPQGQQWGQASPPAAPQGQQWGQSSPPAAPQGQQPWSHPDDQQNGQQWGRASPPAAPQGEQPWSQPGGQQDGQQWGQPDQGQQPPRNPGW